MPFNVSGVFERLYSWVTDRDNSVKINAPRMDAETDGIVTAINSIVDQTQKFTAPLKVVAGTAAAPSIAPDGDANNGVYFPAADRVAITTGGVQRWLLTSTALTQTVQNLGALGSASAPQYSFSAYPNTGVYGTSVGVVLSVLGNAVANFNSTSSYLIQPLAGEGARYSTLLARTVGGTANAITLTAFGTSSLVAGQQVRFIASAANTGATTIDLDGSGALPCVTVTGAALPAGYIMDSAVTTAEYTGSSWMVDRPPEFGGFDTVALLLANTSMGYSSPASVIVTAGQYLLAGGHRYQVAASGASDHDVATAGGVKLYFSAGHGASRHDIGVPLMQLGAIRNNGDQSDAYNFWRLIEDSSHKPIGFRNSAGAGLEIETTDSVIRVHHSIGGDYVGGLIAALDETLAQTGIRLGCSVGLTYSDIWLYRDFMANINRSSGGVWQHDPNNAEPFTAAWNASGYLDITFPDTPNAIGIVQQIGSVEIGQWSAQFQQISATAARIHFFSAKPKKHTARIRWSSGFSVLTGSKGITVGTFSGGLLPVSFTNGDVNDFDIQVTAGGGLNGIGYQCQIRNPSATGFDLQWVNSAGAIVTVADNKMEAFVSAISRSQAEQPSPSTSFALRVLSRSNINPKSISSTDYPAGNIWLVGGVVSERG